MKRSRTCWTKPIYLPCCPCPRGFPGPPWKRWPTDCPWWFPTSGACRNLAPQAVKVSDGGGTPGLATRGREGFPVPVRGAAHAADKFAELLTQASLLQQLGQQ